MNRWLPGERGDRNQPWADRHEWDGHGPDRPESVQFPPRAFNLPLIACLAVWSLQGGVPRSSRQKSTRCWLGRCHGRPRIPPTYPPGIATRTLQTACSRTLSRHLEGPNSAFASLPVQERLYGLTPLPPARSLDSRDPLHVGVAATGKTQIWGWCQGGTGATGGGQWALKHPEKQ